LETTDLDLLAHGGVGLVQQLLDGLVGLEFQTEQFGDVGRLLGRDECGDIRGDLLERRGLRHEVGLTVELEQDAVLGALDVRGHQAVGGGALGTLGDTLGAVDPQDLDGLVKVPVSLLEGLLAVHHPCAGHLAQALDISSADSHQLFSSVVVVSVVSAASAASAAGSSTTSAASTTGASAAGSSTTSTTSTVSVAVASLAAAARSAAACCSSSSRSHSGISSAPSSLAPARAILPSATASAITRVSSVTDRIASSLPGIG